MFGHSRKDPPTMTMGGLSENQPPDTEADARARVEQALSGKWQTFEWRCRRKDRTLFGVEIGCPDRH
jgi:hypothetical protein